mmetsp:Transcript_83073/g.138846  ORF Transcript_83073/g.138846 Transcript_83073/m.138846 type:complete len:239 (-) Transcript_83073:575-1291(-)
MVRAPHRRGGLPEDPHGVAGALGCARGESCGGASGGVGGALPHAVPRGPAGLGGATAVACGGAVGPAHGDGEHPRVAASVAAAAAAAHGGRGDLQGHPLQARGGAAAGKVAAQRQLRAAHHHAVVRGVPGGGHAGVPRPLHRAGARRVHAVDGVRPGPAGLREVGARHAVARGAEPRPAGAVGRAGVLPQVQTRVEGGAASAAAGLRANHGVVPAVARRDPPCHQGQEQRRDALGPGP